MHSWILFFPSPDRCLPSSLRNAPIFSPRPQMLASGPRFTVLRPSSLCLTGLNFSPVSAFLSFFFDDANSFSSPLMAPPLVMSRFLQSKLTSESKCPPRKTVSPFARQGARTRYPTVGPSLNPYGISSPKWKEFSRFLSHNAEE